MSVLICPVCQSPMREVERRGVMIDTCTQCRGVWLDRGELEKLAGAFDNDERFRAAPGYEGRGPASRRRNDDDDPSERSRMSRFLDFFD